LTKQGRIADRSAEAQQFRASGLNLVIAAIVFWNSTYIADAIVHLRATDQSVPDAWLAHTSPLSWRSLRRQYASVRQVILSRGTGDRA
jgi:Tn3 transposase DDE domain-containing protein